MTFTFPETERRTYAETLASFRAGLFSCGFMWEVAKHDEVFAAFIKRERVPKP